jgi:hypothetical protein
MTPDERGLRAEEPTLPPRPPRSPLRRHRSPLRAAGAPDCHVPGGSADTDGRDLPLREALALVVGSRLGALIICIPGELAYHEGEEDNDRWLLHKGVRPL